VAPTRTETTATSGYTAGTYVGKLADQPVATYQGGLNDLKRTAPAPGDRLKTGTTAVRAYLRHLDSRRDQAPGDYTVQYNAPNGTSSQQYTLLLWKVGQNTPAVRPTVTPPPSPSPRTPPPD
jgi:hypothetical protein